MGFWYFGMLFVGIVCLLIAIVKRSQSTVQRSALGFTALVLIGLALFMFQDGSAEIVARLND